ncbi:hypothetical protein GCM10010211_79230 [Streptomyces albospinus]|uniref:Uncharacterized protein n=1 Tax=Streptomyces albospinus TaxID=285515 RepID=A0ABQ2VPJ9_9ACTN|nr:hypothetical protein GCM10010211_79230 [Streptomyces albospinus]
MVDEGEPEGHAESGEYALPRVVGDDEAEVADGRGQQAVDHACQEAAGFADGFGEAWGRCLGRSRLLLIRRGRLLMRRLVPVLSVGRWGLLIRLLLIRRRRLLVVLRVRLLRRLLVVLRVRLLRWLLVVLRVRLLRWEVLA